MLMLAVGTTCATELFRPSELGYWLAFDMLHSEVQADSWLRRMDEIGCLETEKKTKKA